MSVLVVVATFNERENLPVLLERIWDGMPQAQVLVIDDDSPDGTGKWCEQRAVEEPRLSIRIRIGERGLGSATLLGLGQAIELGYEYVATLDADGSHDPSVMPLMFQLLRTSGQATGVVIGSRYVAGGAIEGWPWYRLWISRILNLWVRFVLGLGTRDNSGAFRIYRTVALRSVGIERIRSNGYAYLEELLYRLKQAGFGAEEIPITFRDRVAGVSKASWREAAKVFWRVLKLRLER